MDNISKALLITAAVLIVIVLIATGIKMISSADGIDEQEREVGLIIADKSKDASEQITLIINSNKNFEENSSGDILIGGTSENSGLIIDGWNAEKEKPIVQEKTWYIYTPKQLKFLADFVNNNLTDEEKEVYPDITTDTTVFLMNDLNLKNIDWIPIGNENPFIGIFDGQGYTIREINVNVENFAGLFGRANTIKNLSIVDSTIEGNSYVGSVAGACKNVENCKSENNVVKGTCYVGGIIGFGMENGVVKSCINTSNVISLPNDERKNGTHTGGIVGFVRNGVVISECINKGQIESNSGRVGGIVGDTSTKGILITKSRNEGKVILYEPQDENEMDIDVYAGGIVRTNCN